MLVRRSVEYEYKINKWVQENPEPKLPKWIEWLKDIGVMSELDVKECLSSKSYSTIARRLNVPIPLEIADRLGIKPKEGN